MIILRHVEGFSRTTISFFSTADIGYTRHAATGTAFLLLFAIVIFEAARETLTLGVQSSSPNAKQEYPWGKTLRT